MLTVWVSSVRPASATVPFSSQERFLDACVHHGARGCPPARYWPALPGDIRSVVGHGRPDRQPAEPGHRPVCYVRRRLPAHRRRGADRRLPGGHRQALAGRPGGLDPDHRDRPAGRVLPELLLHRRGADLGAASHPGHHRRRPGHRARRGPGDRTADRPVRGGHHRPGPDRPRPARGPAVWVPRDYGPGQRGHGRARRGRLRRGHPDRL